MFCLASFCAFLFFSDDVSYMRLLEVSRKKLGFNDSVPGRLGAGNGWTEPAATASLAGGHSAWICGRRDDGYELDDWGKEADSFLTKTEESHGKGGRGINGLGHWVDAADTARYFVAENAVAQLRLLPNSSSIGALVSCPQSGGELLGASWSGRYCSIMIGPGCLKRGVDGCSVSSDAQHHVALRGEQTTLVILCSSEERPTPSSRDWWGIAGLEFGNSGLV